MVSWIGVGGKFLPTGFAAMCDESVAVLLWMRAGWRGCVS
jgi:hypothetical protein